MECGAGAGDVEELCISTDRANESGIAGHRRRIRRGDARLVGGKRLIGVGAIVENEIGWPWNAGVPQIVIRGRGIVGQVCIGPAMRDRQSGAIRSRGIINDGIAQIERGRGRGGAAGVEDARRAKVGARRGGVQINAVEIDVVR